VVCVCRQRCTAQRWRADDQCAVTDSAEGAGHRLAAVRADVRPQMGWRRRLRDRVRGGGGRCRPHVRRARGRPSPAGRRRRGGGGGIVVRRPAGVRQIRRRRLFRWLRPRWKWRQRQRRLCRRVSRTVVGVARVLSQQPDVRRQACAGLESAGTGRSDGRGPQRVQPPARAG